MIVDSDIEKMLHKIDEENCDYYFRDRMLKVRVNPTFVEKAAEYFSSETAKGGLYTCVKGMINVVSIAAGVGMFLHSIDYGMRSLEVYYLGENEFKAAVEYFPTFLSMWATTLGVPTIANAIQYIADQTVQERRERAVERKEVRRKYNNNIITKKKLNAILTGELDMNNPVDRVLYDFCQDVQLPFDEDPDLCLEVLNQVATLGMGDLKTNLKKLSVSLQKVAEVTGCKDEQRDHLIAQYGQEPKKENVPRKK